MTSPGPSRRRDSLRALDVLAHTGVAAAHLGVFATVRRLIIGRRLTVRTADGDLTLTVTELMSRPGLRSIAAGRLGDVRLTARDVRWQGHHVDRATAVLRDVRLRTTMPPVLVAEPVEVTVDVPAPALTGLFRWAAPRWSGRVDDDGIATVGFARGATAGRVEVETMLEGTTLWLLPRAVVRRRRWSLPARTPGYPIQLPELPGGTTISAVEVLPGTVRISGVLPRWQADVPRTRLDDLVAQLSVVGRPLTLIWPARER